MMTTLVIQAYHAARDGRDHRNGGLRNVDDPSDEELVRRIRTGDAEASRILYDRYEPRLRSQARRTLRGIVRRRVGDSDVVQDTCLAAFGSLEQFECRGEGSFRRWLQRILQHKARDTVRRQLGTEKRGGGLEISQGAADPEPRLADEAPSPSVAAMGRERAGEVQTAMATLPDEYRTVLDWIHRGGMTLAEVGEATGRSANATCKLYGRAVHALAEVLRRPPRRG